MGAFAPNFVRTFSLAQIRVAMFLKLFYDKLIVPIHAAQRRKSVTVFAAGSE